MNSEQILLNKWRDLTSERQQEVLDFLDFIWQKSVNDKQTQQVESKTSTERVQQWINWAESHPENSPGLPDEALHRDSIYD
jgi:hypothetical protein